MPTRSSAGCPTATATAGAPPTDCDDDDPGAYPGGFEVCNGRDDDCDGTFDEDVKVDFWRDDDGDGWGGPFSPLPACEQPEGYAAQPGDCDDRDPEIHPEAEETCNGKDDDCDGRLGDETIISWYLDGDGDGYGDPEQALRDCFEPSGYVDNDEDCDDTDPAVHPGAEEHCDGEDDDCDGLPDEGTYGTWYYDGDGDGWGDPDDHTWTCAPTAGWTRRGGDCAPDDPTIHPDASETCDGVDQDCDGQADEDFDRDRDGYLSSACADLDPSEIDCDDGAPDAHPGGTETCDDGVDQDCDGRDTFCGLMGGYDLGAATAKLYAPSAGELAGLHMETGDTDGDGLDDLLIAALDSSSSGGGAYLVRTPPAGTAALDEVALHLEAAVIGSGAGASVGLGDTDGDGLADILVGCPEGSSPGARVLLAPFAGDVSLEGEAVLLSAGSSTWAGRGAALGDVTGDGLADALVGADNESGGKGRVYIANGPHLSDLSLTRDADGILTGTVSASYTGRVVRGGQDLDGDGIGDILAAGPYASVAAVACGVVYVVHGPVSGNLSLVSADGTLVGESVYAAAGTALAVGDLDGDGLSDVMVGSPGESSPATGAGAAYVILGPASGTHALAAADLVLRGATVSGALGSGIAAHDVDGDGKSEMLVGAVGESTAGSQAGAAFLFFGPRSGTLTEADADAVFYGAGAGDRAGQGVAMGDLDGDGRGDIVVGAAYDATGGTSAGAVFLQYPE
ncbi:MAG: MopE-related protein [Pseudomonadota bacterium]